MTSRTRSCDDAVTRGRLRKAEQFWEAAELTREFADDEAEVGDAYVTLCVHAGIAAADVICCVGLGEHAVGEDHNEALVLLGRVCPGGKELTKALAVLLGMKTLAGYSASPVSSVDRKRAQRQAERLLQAARDRSAVGWASPAREPSATSSKKPKAQLKAGADGVPRSGRPG